MNRVLSWGRYPRYPQTPHGVRWQEDVPKALADIVALKAGGALAFGCGRSYGDSCLAASDHVLATRQMDRVLAADWEKGIILAQSGLTLDELIRMALPRGFFLPVTPGTKFVTLGGAVANDIHGKNHHLMGTFGRHVRRLVVYRSDEGIAECSSTIRPGLFAATIGGLGLTGIILAVEVTLQKVASSVIEQRMVKFRGLDEFFEISREYDASHAYTVAWVDCLATGQSMGRGYYIAGNHATDGPLEVAPRNRLAIPVDPPFSLVNRLSLRVFNTLYYHRHHKREIASRVGYDPFFFPLDDILHWNRIYGRAGFQQYQCVVPQQRARETLRAVLQQISRSGAGSFLAVVKRCGGLASPGLLSFPLEGTSLALDFPQRAEANECLFGKLAGLIHEAGGRLYPAKDSHMSGAHFRQAYPQWEKVEALRDPLLMSRFWARVTQ